MKSYSRQPVKKRRFRLRAAAVLAALVAAGYSSVVLLWPLQAVEAKLLPLPAITTTAAPLAWPSQGQAAIGTSDGVLATQNDTAAMPMASITKVVTALTVLEAKPLAAGQPGPSITFTAADAALYNEYLAKNGSVARADAGLQLTQYQMLQGMLIASANNYADSLALWAYGSPEAYLTAAQAYLAKHKLTNTAVADMTGFSPDSKSTASDLVRLGALALRQPVIAEIVSQKTAVIPGVGTLQNTNLLLGSDGVSGIKTGTTDEAGACLLFSATHKVGAEDITVIGVILGAPNHATLFSQVKSLLIGAKPNFQEVTLAKAGQAVGTYSTPWGAQTQATMKTLQTQVTWAGTPVTQRTTLQAVQPATNPGTVGTVTSKTGARTQTAEARLATPLPGPNWHWRLTHPFEVFDL